MNNLTELAPDINISINQVFGIDTDMKIEGFQKKMNSCLKLTVTINLTEIQLWQSFLVLLSTNAS